MKLIRCAISLLLLSTTAFGEPTLKGLADKKGMYFGAFGEYRFLQKGDPYASVFKQEFSLMTIGVYPEQTQPHENQFYFDEVDVLARFAIDNQIKIRVHPLVWWNEDIEPDVEWMKKYEKEPDKLSQVLKTHIQTVAGHFKQNYSGHVVAIDVVNEPLENLGHKLRKNIWWNLHPEQPELYIHDAFRWAHEAYPDAKLFLNEIFSERDDKKFNALLTLIRSLQKAKIPIHGVGIQMHQFMPLGKNVSVQIPNEGMVLAVAPKKIRERLKQLEKLGLEIQFTEMDIPLLKNGDEEKQFKAQAELYEGYVKACVDSTSCKAVTVWGVSDKDSWIPLFFPSFDRPLLFDDNFNPKPAYDGVTRALE